MIKRLKQKIRNFISQTVVSATDGGGATNPS